MPGHAPDRGDVDDLAGAPLFHGRNHRLGAEVGALDVHREHAVQVLGLDLLQGQVLGDAGVVDLGCRPGRGRRWPPPRSAVRLPPDRLTSKRACRQTPPASRIRASVSSEGLMSARMTFAPEVRRRPPRGPGPSPDAAPVINAVLPSSDAMARSLCDGLPRNPSLLRRRPVKAAYAPFRTRARRRPTCCPGRLLPILRAALAGRAVAALLQ